MESQNKEHRKRLNQIDFMKRNIKTWAERGMIHTLMVRLSVFRNFGKLQGKLVSDDRKPEEAETRELIAFFVWEK